MDYFRIFRGERVSFSPFNHERANLTFLRMKSVFREEKDEKVASMKHLKNAFFILPLIL